MKEEDLFSQLKKYCENYKEQIFQDKESQIKKSLSFLKNKAKTLEDIFKNSQYLLNDTVKINQDDLKLIDEKSKKIIKEFIEKILNLNNFERSELEPIVKSLISKFDTNFKGVGQPLRIVLTGSRFGPGIYDILTSLGKVQVVERLKNI